MADFHANPGDRSVTELEREVDRERERVSSTIDELQSRATVANLVDQVVKAVTENGGEVSRNLGRSLRDNPLPALLTGVGLAWLMASGGRARAAERWEDADDDYRRYDPERFEASPPTSDYDADDLFEPDPDYAGVRGDPDAAGFPERVSETADTLRARAANAASQIGGQIADTAGGFGERTAEFSRSAQSQLSGAGQSVRDAGHAARRRAEMARRRAASAGHDVRQGFDTLVEEQPLVLGALAMALGAALGGALPRSDTEDRLLGARSDRAKQTARDLAGVQGRKIKTTVGAVANEALGIVGEAAADLDSRLPSGSGIVEAVEERVRDAADRLREAASAEVNREDPSPSTRSD